MTDPNDPRVPAASYFFGYAAIAPIVLAAIATWTLPRAWPVIAVHLAVIWTALILAYVGGVRRGFGFATPGASTAVEVASSLAYFTFGGLGLLLLPDMRWAPWPLMVGLTLVALLDRRAAVRGLAPAHFARLRVPQMLLGVAALAAIWARVVV